jgi:hypothetical protein
LPAVAANQRYLKALREGRSAAATAAACARRPEDILGEQAQKIFVEISYQRLATLGLTAQALFCLVQC